MNWMEHLSNPYSKGIKKISFDLLKERYGNYEKIIDQVSKNITNNKEYEEFGKFLLEFYEAGFFKAVEDHRQELKKLGYKVTLKETKPIEKSEPIF